MARAVDLNLAYSLVTLQFLSYSWPLEYVNSSTVYSFIMVSYFDSPVSLAHSLS